MLTSPVSSGPPPPDAAHESAGEGLEHLGMYIYLSCCRLLTNLEGVPDDELNEAIHPDNTAVTTGADTAPKKKQHGRRILSAIKGVTKGGVETILGTDRLKAAAGAEHAKNRLGVLRSETLVTAGPIDFPCRYKGKKGHAYITTTATSPAVSWTTNQEDIDPIFSIAIADIAVCFFS